MSDPIDFRVLLTQSRPRVYLLWAIITAVGFTATHYYQNSNINGVWFGLAVIGLGYMYKVMPLRVKQMRSIYLSWLLPISIGIVASGLAVHTELFPSLIGYLGVMWLFLMAAGYLANGLVDPPAGWYFVAAGINVVAGILCCYSDDFLRIQYLVAAVVSAWSMLNLWFFRGDA